MEWEVDRGLQARVVLALAFVVVLPFAFVLVMLGLLNTVGIELLEWATERPWNGRFYVDPVVLVALVALGFAVQYLFSEGAALRSVGARRVTADEYPDLHARLTRLASTADVPVPRLAVADSDVPNAFTIGRRPAHATVVVTTGLLDRLDTDETDAVLAHELAHVKNRDVTVMTLAFFLPTLTFFAAMASYFVLKGIFHVLGSFRHVDDDGAKAVVVAVVVLVVSAILTLAVSALFWAGSFLLFRLLSRYREHAADRGAAAITGEPAALASALRELDDGMSGMPDDDLRELDGGLEALYVAPIDTYQFGSERELLSSDLFPSTHPPTAERIERLRELAREVETA